MTFQSKEHEPTQISAVVSLVLEDGVGIPLL